jgi:tetraacyldisaccharide 4'-kinase
MRELLLPFSSIYGAGVTLRNMLFDIGIRKVRAVGVPVISVGNLSAGGVGKTPFVELLARRLTSEGRRIAIVSRGYKREGTGTVVVSNGSVVCVEASLAGDEPTQLAEKLKGVVVVVDERRVRGARYAVKQFGVDLILLDDGFQHRSIHRDLDVVLLSAAEVLSDEHLLPAGNLREPFGSLRRADLIVLSRCTDEAHFLRLEDRLRTRIVRPMIGVRVKARAVRRATTRFSIDLNGVKGKSVAAFSGIGNPASFEDTLKTLGVQIDEHMKFADHHRFQTEDLRLIEEAARRVGADYVLTTEKDLVRLGGASAKAGDFLERNPVYYVEIEEEIIGGDQHLTEALQKLNRSL